MKNSELIRLAKNNIKNSYSPYSNFKVSAALLSKSGNVYLGINIENASFGATLCAERSAFAAAISAGEREFEKIAIVSSNDEFCPPCGICRQVIGEFCDSDFEVVLSRANEEKSYKFGELMPTSFFLER